MEDYRYFKRSRLRETELHEIVFIWKRETPISAILSPFFSKVFTSRGRWLSKIVKIQDWIVSPFYIDSLKFSVRFFRVILPNLEH